MATKPASLDFDDEGIASNPLPHTYGGLYFEPLETYYTIMGEIVHEASGNQYLSMLVSPNGRSGYTGFVLKADDGSKFQLLSVRVLASTDDLMVVGNNGLLERIDLQTSGTYGTVSYTFDGAQGGIVTFGAAWADQSSVRFGNSTPGPIDGYSISIDDIVLNNLKLSLAAGSDTGSSSIDGITKDITPEFTGTADPDSLVTVTIDGDTLSAQVLVGADGNFKIDNLGKELADGVHVIAVEDSNHSKTSVTITVDTKVAAPTELALDSTTIGENTTRDSYPTLTGKAEPFATIDLYEGNVKIGSGTTGANGVWYAYSDIALADGVHQLTVVQTDVAGNVSVASAALPVTIDRGIPTKPVLDIDSDSGTQGDNITRINTPTLTGTARESAYIELKNEAGDVLGSGFAGNDGKWSITVGQYEGAEPREPESFKLDDGVHVIHAEITELYFDRSMSSMDVREPLAGPALSLTIDTVANVVAATLDQGSDSGTKNDGITNVTRPLLTGTAEAGATVTILEGDKELAKVIADSNGHWSVQTSTLAPGKHTLVAIQKDVAGNTSEIGDVLQLTIERTSAPTPPTTVDGVSVITKPVTTPGGGTGTSITVPVVTSGRTEQSGDAGTADIPLTEKNGASLLTAKVHTGYGLTANGGIAQGSASSLAELIAAIKQTGSTNGISDVTHLTNGGTSFLSLLPNDASLLVQTVRVTGSDTDGSGALDLVGSTDTRAAIVLDATQLAAGTHITLTDIPFAAVFGAVNVTATTAGQILTGDAQGQQFVVSTGAGSTVLSGGGADTLQFGIGASAGTSAANGQAAASTTLLHGGTEADVAVFKGAAADFNVEQHDGYVLVSSKATPEQVAKLVNIESLKFDDQTVAIESRVELNTLAGLYETVLGRQADVGGFDYWGGIEHAGSSLGTVAVAIISSVEGTARLGALNGDTAHDVEILYKAFFERASDAGGKAYWVGQMANGASLEDVADAMAHSVEIIGHQKAVTAWDFAV